MTVLLLLSGCTTIDHIVGIGPVNPPPSPTGAFDGSYYGEADTVRARPGQCPADRLGMAEVGDKRLSFAYAPQIIFNPPVQPDGTLHGVVGPSTLNGRITGRRLVMTVITPNCETHYNLHLVGNRS